MDVFISHVSIVDRQTVLKLDILMCTMTTDIKKLQHISRKSLAIARLCNTKAGVAAA